MKQLKIQKLLVEILEILSRYRVEHWADRFKGLNEQFTFALESEDPVRLRLVLASILSVFGGMGSLNDVNIYHKAGFPIAVEEEEFVNQVFQNLQEQLYVAARDESARLKSKQSKPK